MIELLVKRFGADGVVPSLKTEGAAGLDLVSPIDFTIARHKQLAVALQIGFAIPDGYVGLIKERSSWALRGLLCLGGVIDADFRGEVRGVFLNTSQGVLKVTKGERVAQLLILPYLRPSAVTEVTELPESDRDDGGFGSTGR